MPRSAALLGCLLSLLTAREALAQSAGIDPEIVGALGALRSPSGPSSYAALRGLWRLWDRADPSQVEEALAVVSGDRSLSPSARVYARLLEAYARRRRGDLDGAKRRIERLGFVNRFLVVGPFENENRTGLNQAGGPEGDLNEPISFARTYAGKERTVRWRLPPESNNWGWFDLGEYIRPRNNVCAYATTYLRLKNGAKSSDVSIWMGAQGAFKLFRGNNAILTDTGYRDLDVERFAVTVRLSQAFERFTVKVCSDEAAPKFAMRVGTANGEPTDIVDAAALPKELPGQKAAFANASTSQYRDAVRNSSVDGAMQAFQKKVSNKDESPRDLEAFARYLASTGGEAFGEHLARDLAFRAAEREPTVARLLLAGELAEDRNQRREWVSRAAKLVAPSESNIELLLAQADLARTSVNPRDAIPIYEKILKIEPDHLLGTLQFADLYAEAGLKRSALALLERALNKKPRSIALLRSYAAELRSLGRDTEASEAEARYAHFRFDDPNFLAAQVDLAIARRDIQGLEHWLTRFTSLEENSSWARGVLSRGYRAASQRDKALALYQQALLRAPDDVEAMRELSDIYGEQGNREQQIKLLRQIVAIEPQNKAVRDYLEHVAPSDPRPDETYAWAADRFLPMRDQALGDATLATGEKKNPAFPQRTLRNLIVSTVYPSGLASQFRQVIYQPLTDEAAASGREYGFGFHGDRQIVTLRAAKVFRGNGAIDEAIETGIVPANDPAMAMYTSEQVFYVRFPKLNPTDIVELRYRVDDVSPRNEIADYFGEILSLQAADPIFSSEYILLTPKNRTFFINWPALGAKPVINETDRFRVYRYEAQNLRPVPDEPDSPPWSEIAQQVHVSTFDSWKAVGDWYWSLARERLDVDDEVRRVVQEITTGLTEPRQKVQAIYRYVTNLRYVALEFGIESIRPRRAAQTVARGWGDCKDKAALLVTMLREVQVPAELVLVRTGMRGILEDRPASLAVFDHAIAYVPSLDLYLDGTAEHTGITELPPMDQGSVALRIIPGDSRLVRLPVLPAEASVFRRKFDIALVPDGSANVTGEIEVSGAQAARFRQRFLAEGVQRQRIAEAVSEELGTLQLASGNAGVDTGTLEDVEKPVHLRIRGKAKDIARTNGSQLSIPVAPRASLGERYASLSKRSTDVVLPALETREEEWTVHIPSGMKVARAPLPLAKDTPFGSFSVSFEQERSRVRVKARIVLHKRRIAPSEYDGFRAFCEATDRAFGQRLVLSPEGT